MPELPEVEVIKKGIAPLLIGREIQKITCSDYQLRRPIPKIALSQWIKGAKVTKVDRRAKYLRIYMDNGALLVVHFGMTGNLGIFNPEIERAKHDHVLFRLDNQTEIRFNDTRRFGSIDVFGPFDSQKVHFFYSLGPEPFWHDFSALYLKKKAGPRRQAVKNFLMDNRIVVGIGNIYANEILFAAAVLPVKAVAHLKMEEWKLIVTKTRLILRQAIRAGGSTISDFVNSSQQPGYFQLQLNVYGKKNGEPCPQCNNSIEKINQSGRATYYCTICQK